MKSFDPYNCIEALNNVKRAMQLTERPFTKESMIKSLKGCGLPTNPRFWSVFRKSGIIQEVSKGKFMFSSKEPIYVGTLIKIKSLYKETRSKKNKEIVPTVEPEVIVPKEETEIQKAITLLKENGYLIYAPKSIEYTLV